MRTIPLLVCVSLAACGGPGSVDGTIKGQKYDVSSAASAAITISFTGGSIHGAAIGMTNTSGFCKDVGNDVVHPGQRFVAIFLADVNNLSFTTPTVPGTYAIYQSNTNPPPKAATMGFTSYDATCQKIDSQSANATSGSVILESVSGNKFTGTYDVVLEGGDHVTGNFDPEGCPAIQTAFQDDTSTCQ